MFKKYSTVILCIALLLSFTACSKDETRQNGETTNQSENSSGNDISQQINSAEENEHIFKTENIKRITFYAYYGAGKGSDVSDEHLDEIITWLKSFKIDSNRRVPDVIPPGTNSIHVEIEYLDGSIVKQGMDATIIDGVTYYICGDSSPECYDEIISKTALN